MTNENVERNGNGKPAVSPRPVLAKQRTIELDDRGNLIGEDKNCMKELAEQNIVVNVRGKGKSGIDQTSQMANLKFDEQGNLIKEQIPKTGHSPPEQKMNYIANAVMSQASWNNPAPHPGYYGTPQLTTQMLASSVQAANGRVGAMGMGKPAPVTGNNSSVTIVENGRMNNYIIPNSVGYPVSRPIPQQPVVQQPIQAEYAKPQERVVQPFLQNMRRANTINETRQSKNLTGEMVKTYSLDMNSDSAPFGPRLSMKTPKQRFKQFFHKLIFTMNVMIINYEKNKLFKIIFLGNLSKF